MVSFIPQDPVTNPNERQIYRFRTLTQDSETKNGTVDRKWLNSNGCFSRNPSSCWKLPNKKKNSILHIYIMYMTSVFGKLFNSRAMPGYFFLFHLTPNQPRRFPTSPSLMELGRQKQRKQHLPKIATQDCVLVKHVNDPKPIQKKHGFPLPWMCESSSGIAFNITINSLQ